MLTPGFRGTRSVALASANVVAGWAAYLSAAETVATTATGVLTYTRAGRFGRISDSAGVLQMMTWEDLQWQSRARR